MKKLLLFLSLLIWALLVSSSEPQNVTIAGQQLPVVPLKGDAL